MLFLVQPFVRMICGVACALHILANVDVLSERREVAVVLCALGLAGILVIEFVEEVLFWLWRRARRIRRETDAR